MATPKNEVVHLPERELYDRAKNQRRLKRQLRWARAVRAVRRGSLEVVLQIRKFHAEIEASARAHDEILREYELKYGNRFFGMR